MAAGSSLRPVLLVGAESDAEVADSQNSVSSEDEAEMFTCDKIAAAYHEAGHAATSLRLGCAVKELALFWSKDRQRWEGKYHHLHVTATSFFEEPIRLEKNSKVAVAGVLAQAKYQASR